jgi:hypothetical protein
LRNCEIYHRSFVSNSFRRCRIRILLKVSDPTGSDRIWIHNIEKFIAAKKGSPLKLSLERVVGEQLNMFTDEVRPGPYSEIRKKHL